MKSIIITRKQLAHCVNEENNVNVGLQTTANTIPAMVNTITQNKPDINQASRMGDPIIHISNPNSQNGSNDNQLTQHVEVGKGESVESAMEKQLNPSATGAGGDVEISGDGLSETRSYSKKDVERARLAKMKSEGKVMTKKQLKESFLK
jgi:hypothetical protein